MKGQAFDLGHFDSSTPTTNLFLVLVEREQVASLLFQYAGSKQSPKSHLYKTTTTTTIKNCETQFVCNLGAQSSSSMRMLWVSAAGWHNLEFCSLPLIHINLNDPESEVTVKGLGVLGASDILLFFNIHSFIIQVLNPYNGQGIIKKRRHNKTNKTWFLLTKTSQPTGRADT